MATQRYLGSPNAVVLCIQKIDKSEIEPELKGEMFHSYQEEGIAFDNLEQMVNQMEQFFDWLGFPQRSTNSRSFFPQPLVQHHSQEEKVMKDEQVLSKHGELGTFIVRVQHRQNSSWQGRLTWVEEDKTINFRSIWEMIKLIESAVDTVSEPEDEESQGWDL
jgi:hypothetical protein